MVIALSVVLPGNVVHAAPPSVAIHLALGDSLAVGIGATNPENRGYAGRFNRFLKLSLANLAVSGETSTTFINGGQLEAAIAAITDPETDIAVVTLDIGGNDLLDLLGSVPCALDPTGLDCQMIIADALTTFVGKYIASIVTLTGALAADPGEESVLVMTYYNPFDGTGSVFEAPVDVALLGTDGVIDCAANADPANVGLNDLIACIGSSFGAIVVDTHPLFDDEALELTHIAEGDIHPNNDGYAVIANAFKDTFKESIDDDKD